MAVSTVTSTQAVAGIEPRLAHTGVQAASATYVHSGTVGDVVLMVKVPAVCDIIGIYGKITTAETAANATVGLAGGGLSANTLSVFGSLASGTAPVFSDEGARKYRVSLSDDAAVRHTYVAVSPSSATWTISATIDLTVLYTAVGSS